MIAVWLLTIASFFIVALAPGDAVLSVLRIDDVAVSKTEIDATRERMGLNDPLIVRYWHYLEGLLRGDMGTSVMTGKPVSYEISKALPASAILSGVSCCWLLRLLLCCWGGWLRDIAIRGWTKSSCGFVILVPQYLRSGWACS